MLKRSFPIYATYIILLISSLAGCKTIELPADVEKMTLSGDYLSDTAVLIIQDIRWRLWANNARYVIGEISRKEYEKNRDYYLDIIDRMGG